MPGFKTNKITSSSGVLFLPSPTHHRKRQWSELLKPGSESGHWVDHTICCGAGALPAERRLRDGGVILAAGHRLSKLLYLKQAIGGLALRVPGSLSSGLWPTEALDISFGSINIHCESSSRPCIWPLGGKAGKITFDEHLCAWHLSFVKAVATSVFSFRDGQKLARGRRSKNVCGIAFVCITPFNPCVWGCE